MSDVMTVNERKVRLYDAKQANFRANNSVSAEIRFNERDVGAYGQCVRHVTKHGNYSVYVGTKRAPKVCHAHRCSVKLSMALDTLPYHEAEKLGYSRINGEWFKLRKGAIV